MAGDNVHRPGRADAATAQHCGERRAVHQLHHQERRLRRSRLDVVVDPGDILVRQRTGALSLGAEPGQRLRMLNVVRHEQLDRDEPGQDNIRGTPHLAVATRGDLVLELVTAGQLDDA